MASSLLLPLGPVEAVVLGVVQGLTELLPVSSSAHLFVVPTLLGWRYEGLAFDVALHGGTVIALLAAFWRDWWALATQPFHADAGVRRDARALWLRLVVATIPAAVVGKLLDTIPETHLRSLLLQAAMLAAFGALLWAADRFLPRGEDTDRPGWRAALVIGFAQCLALVPGVSRSGVTMTAGRVAGLSRVSAARFSFLLATPITLGALVLKLPDVPRDLPLGTLALAVAAAAASGLLAIRLLLGMLRHTGFGVFFIVVWMQGRG
jgi:undecaprenyl-diphosphatase